MSITMQAAPAREWVLTRATGRVTYAEIAAHLDEEERARAVHEPELFDATGATTDITATQVRALVHRADAMLRRGGVGPTAIVADDAVFFGMARMYELLAELDGIAVAVFRDVAAAERWLAERTAT
jgi:2-hydroxychromene-2-carboxylate isomerase